MLSSESEVRGIQSAKLWQQTCFHKPGAGTGEGYDSCCCYIRTCDYNPRREFKIMVSLLDQIIILLSNIVTDFYSILTLETPKRYLTQVHRSSLHAVASQCRFTITQYIVRTKNIADHETYSTEVWFKSVDLPVSQNVWSYFGFFFYFNRQL